MRIVTIAEAKAMAPGEAIPAMRGRLKRIGEWKEGESEYGHWTMQNAFLSDGNGEIKLKLKNRPTMDKSWEGREVYLEAAPGDKKPFLGLTREIDTYRGANNPMIQADDRVTMTECEGHQPAATPPPAQAPAPQPRPAQAPAPAPTQHAPAQEPARVTAQPKTTTGHHHEPESPDDLVKDAKRRICQRANLYLLCYRMGQVNRATVKRSGEEMTDGQFQGMVASIFISVDKLGLHQSMPVMPIEI